MSPSTLQDPIDVPFDPLGPQYVPWGHLGVPANRLGFRSSVCDSFNEVRTVYLAWKQFASYVAIIVLHNLRENTS